MFSAAFVHKHYLWGGILPGLLLYWPQVIQSLKGLLCLSHTVGSCPLRAASWFGRYLFWWRTAFQLWATYMCWLMCDSRTHALSKATAGSWCESLLHHSVVRAAAQAHVASREVQILQHKIWSFKWSSVVRDALLQCSLLLRSIERLQLLLAGLPSWWMLTAYAFARCTPAIVAVYIKCL